MGKRKYRQIITCLLSATLTGSLICSSIVFASETPSASAKKQELNESTISIENRKEGTETRKLMDESQVKTTVSSNKEVNEIQPFAENNNAGDFNVIGDTGWEYDNDANTLTLKTSGTYTVTGNGTATTERIIVTGNITATITLNNVNIDMLDLSEPAFYAKSPFQSNIHLTIILQGKNSLKSGNTWAGITWIDTNENSTLEIKGKGTLTAIGGDEAAGIGGCFQYSGSNITITEGTITATGGMRGAGIGGGSSGLGSNITISGGTVTAIGGMFGAGIGGGSRGSGNNITITKGTVTATGGVLAAGIGGGESGSGSNITISGGTVITTGGDNGAGIGGGDSGSGNKIKITGGTVTATGGNLAAGIGGSCTGSGNNITISGGTVIATGGNNGAGIGGGGMYGPASNITITGGTVTATGGDAGAGIGGGNNGSGSNITITGGSVKASSIGSTPIDENGVNVYLVKLENQDNVNEATVDSQKDNQKKFTRAGNHSDEDTAFYLYLTGENHTITSNNITYKIIWQENTSSFKVSAPSPTFTTTQTASSITINLTNYQLEYGQVQYKWDKGDWGTSNTLSNLGANTTHTVSVRYEGKGDYPQSVEQTQEVKTKSADYTITIPTVTLEAGKDDSTSTISVNQNMSFDLGYNGKVNVKIKNDNTVTDKAELKLIRQNDTENHTITSALLVNGTSLGNINENVAEFTMSNKEPVSVSFAKPTEEKILAGTYKGTITFEVSYSDQ